MNCFRLWTLNLGLWARCFANDRGAELPGDYHRALIGFENEVDLASAKDNWVMIAPYGDHEYDLGGQPVIQRFDRPAADAMVTWFDSLAGKVVRLFQGVPLFNGHPDQDPAQYPDQRLHGRFVALAARADGLWGQLLPEPSGKALVNARVKIKLSPRWFAADEPVATENGVPVYRPLVLASVGLTNRPNLKGAPTLPFLNEEPENQKEKTGMKDLLLFIATCLGFANEAPAEGQDAKPELITKMKDGIKSLSEKAKTADTLTVELANEKRDRAAAVAKLTGERDTAKTEFANERQARVGELVGAAIADGRITAAEKADWERRLTNDFANEAPALAKLAKKVKTFANAHPTGKGSTPVNAQTVAAISAAIDIEEAKLPAGTKNRRTVAFANAKKAKPELFATAKEETAE